MKKKEMSLDTTPNSNCEKKTTSIGPRKKTKTKDVHFCEERRHRTKTKQSGYGRRQCGGDMMNK
ncbi:Uncharacterized protein APZ42_018482 [Daphnia magna]|uniref:Uncharacterized protein n=1 Tax=Daphnia magna TaxID=35525 RepID=A0A164Z2N7_9CRUS|nr:Uncharacterized protein APZ42_018482 [Daphnia magna]